MIGFKGGTKTFTFSCSASQSTKMRQTHKETAPNLTGIGNCCDLIRVRQRGDVDRDRASSLVSGRLATYY
jgi:hypothetical protein